MSFSGQDTILGSHHLIALQLTVLGSHRDQPCRHSVREGGAPSTLPYTHDYWLSLDSGGFWETGIAVFSCVPITGALNTCSHNGLGESWQISKLKNKKMSIRKEGGRQRKKEKREGERIMGREDGGWEVRVINMQATHTQN